MQPLPALALSGGSCHRLTQLTAACSILRGIRPGAQGPRLLRCQGANSSSACRIQSLFNSLGDEAKGKTIGLGGDGRYYNKKAAQIIIKLAAANGIKKVLVGQEAIMATPAMSALIRQRKLYGMLLRWGTAGLGAGHGVADRYETTNGAVHGLYQGWYIVPLAGAVLSCGQLLIPRRQAP